MKMSLEGCKTLAVEKYLEETGTVVYISINLDFLNFNWDTSGFSEGEVALGWINDNYKKRRVELLVSCGEFIVDYSRQIDEFLKDYINHEVYKARPQDYNELIDSLIEHYIKFWENEEKESLQ